MTTLSAAVCAMPALAQDAPSPSSEPPKVEVTGFVDTYYGYNFNEVDPWLRSFDVQHNTLSLSLAEVAFEKAVSEDSRLGFRIDLDFGKTADLVASFEPEENGVEVYKHIQQAYVSVQAAQTLTIDAGKFVTPIGAEVIESQDNWNYTRSILFGYAIPFYHVGVRASVAPSDNFSLTGFLVNGWNNGAETNDGKTVALSASFGGDSWSWIANVMTGPEVSKTAAGDPDDEYLTIWDTTLSVDVSPRFSVMGNFDHGTWKFAGDDVKWYGLAAYAKFQANERWGVVARYEWINDEDGGFMTIGQKAQSFTLTSDHDVLDGLRMRLEYRLDKTDAGYFEKSDGSLTDSQSTLTVGLVYGFNGKI